MKKVRIDFTLSTKSPVSEAKGNVLREYVDVMGNQVGLTLTKEEINESNEHQD